jgi:hypothetical protein
MGIDMAVVGKKNLKASVYDYVNNAYRGFTPGGLPSSETADYTDIGPDPVPIGSTDVNDEYVLPDNTQDDDPTAVPVVIVSDISHTIKRIQKENLCQTVNINPVGSTLVLPKDPYRTQAIISAAGLTSGVILGHNESVGTGGFVLPDNSVIVLGTTEELWAVQGGTPTAIVGVSVLIERDKDIYAS